MKQHTDALAEAAAQVLAEEGSRGFTHRAVDRRARVPEGTASRYARTRGALLALASDAVFAADSQRVLGPVADEHFSATATIPGVTALLVGATKTLLSAPERYRARMELQMEAARTESTQGYYRESRNAFVEPLAAILEGLGLDDARGTADVLVTVIDGVLHRQLIVGETALTDDRLSDVFAAILDHQGRKG